MLYGISNGKYLRLTVGLLSLSGSVLIDYSLILMLLLSGTCKAVLNISLIVIGYIVPLASFLGTLALKLAALIFRWMHADSLFQSFGR